MKNRYVAAAVMCALLPMSLGGCTYYQVAQDLYDRHRPGSTDPGLLCSCVRRPGCSGSAGDRSAGVVQGTRDGITITANVRTQADKQCG